jgi:hypothetical protein
MSDQTAPVSDPNPDNIEDVGGTVLLGKPNEAAPAPAAPADVPPEAEGFEYEPTGDAGLDLALQFIGKAGITTAHPGMVAAQNGDFSILKATLAAKGITGWEQFVALGEEAYKRNQEAASKKDEALKSLVHDAAGGAENWQEVQKWASANADPDEKAEINAMLAAGGLQARQAVRYLVECYNKATDVVKAPVDPTRQAGRSGIPAADSGPLSPRAYAYEVARLNVKLRGRLEGSKEYEALQARRLAWRG